MEKTPKWRNGRRRGLKIPCPQGREGSTPFFGRKKRGNRRILALLFFSGGLLFFFWGKTLLSEERRVFPQTPFPKKAAWGSASVSALLFRFSLLGVIIVQRRLHGLLRQKGAAYLF